MREESNHTIIYELKQHTPLIHFQYDADGACLRASEVKPKFDNFLLKKFQENNINYDEWILKSERKSNEKSEQIEHVAFNYKLSFKSINANKIEIGYKTDYDIYYGNMGGNGKKVQGIKGDSTVKIICFIPELLEKIKKYIDDFFIVTNFGRMQGKGFGSFTIKDSKKAKDTDTICNLLMENVGAENCYYFDGESSELKKIKVIYSIMKSGLNNRGYQRSLLFLYMHDKKIDNEKAFLKQEGMAPKDVGPNAKRGENRTKDKNPKYVRALLGVGDHLDFINDFNDRKNKTSIKISNSEIERLASPIFFKIINHKVYYVGKKMNEKIYNAQFKFSSDCKFLSEAELKEMSIFVPDKNEFLIDDFLKYCYKKFSEESSPLKTFGDTREIQIKSYK